MSSSNPNIHLAVDLGASSGRVLAIGCDQSNLQIDTLHRFENNPIKIGNGLYWNHLALWTEIQRGIGIGGSKFGKSIKSVGVDTWGVDYLLLDSKGMPTGPGYCYRDQRNVGMMERAFQRLSRKDIFEESGIQFMQINTLYQLLAQRLEQPKVLDCTDTFLMVPDFLHWLLSGTKTNEATNASTTQILRPGIQQWSTKICDAMEFNPAWFLDPIQPATNLGRLASSVAEFTNTSDVDVICPATHDTASAVIAVPVPKFKETKPAWGYISSGTWSLMGVELDHPVINDQSLQLNFTNEAGPDGTVRLLKNIAGLWPMQQVRQQELIKGNKVDWAQMIASAESVTSLMRIINLDDTSLINPANMQEAVCQMLQKTGQSSNASLAEMTRLLLESLAMRYRVCLGWLESLLGYQLECLYIVGGGVQNELLCQMTADATNRRVIAAHSEATAIGNALMQAVGTRTFGSIIEARTWLGSVLQPKEYYPQRPKEWDDAWERFSPHL